MDTIFGIPGDNINGIMESLRKKRDVIRFIATRHEEAAVFAAVGYARFSGKMGVCLATTGPGAIHLLNGLYDARMDQQDVDQESAPEVAPPKTQSDRKTRKRCCTSKRKILRTEWSKVIGKAAGASARGAEKPSC